MTIADHRSSRWTFCLEGQFCNDVHGRSVPVSSSHGEGFGQQRQCAGGPRNLHGPLWMVLLAGLSSLAASPFLFNFGRANASGDPPSDASPWMRVAQYLIGVAIFGSFAMIGS